MKRKIFKLIKIIVMLSMIAGLVSAFVNWLVGTNTNESNTRSVRENNELQRQLAGQANQWNIDQWNRENQYNTPSSQMSRLRDAGLNPSLAMTGGSLMNEAAASPSANIANTQAAQNISPTTPDPLTVAQIANLNAQTDNIEAKTKTEDQMRQATYDNLVSSTNVNAAQVSNIASQIEQRAKQNQLTSVQIDKIKFDRMMEGKNYALNKERLRNETNLTNKQIDLLDEQVRKTLADRKVTEREYNEMIWTFGIRRLGLERQVELTTHQSEVAKSTALKLGLDINMLEGPAHSEKLYAEALRGEHGNLRYLYAAVRSNFQMLTRDVGNILGILK